MALEHIENMTVAELKAARDELIKEAAKVDPLELAGRYMQARIDSKVRDEKLAEQGATITKHEATIETLNSFVKEKSELLAKREGDIRDTENLLVAEQNTSRTLRESALQATREAQAVIEQVKAELHQVVSERDAARKLAEQRRAALAKILQDTAPLLVSQE